ncbi:MAG: CRISPR-associated endonuclease Cas2 [Culicoidibacterales bacterium]
MSISNKFIYMVMYDIPIQTSKDAKAYRTFRKCLLNFGAYQLQESIYIIHLNNKAKSKKIYNELVILAPKEANIRGLIMTQSNFEAMEVISGEVSIGEKLIKRTYRIIEI